MAPLSGVGMDKGGTIIEYDKEDPEIRRRYEEMLRLEGVEFQMPASFELSRDSAVQYHLR